MKSNSVREIARSLGVSIATVSRALNYQGGVTGETAELIRRTAKEMGYTPSCAGESPFCGIVLPHKPTYFWGTMCQSLCDALQQEQVSFQTAIYPIISTENLPAFFSALDRIVNLHPAVLVVSAPNCGQAKERLKEVAKDIPVFLLSENMVGNDFFYFGNDAKQDSITLARAFQSRFPHRKRMLIIDQKQYALQTAAFISACSHVQVVHRLELPDWHYSSSAILARLIQQKVSAPFDCVYCGTGALPKVCLALDKLKIDSETICIGYENPPGNAKFLQNGRIGLSLCQDVAAQSRLCAKAVADYHRTGALPEQQLNYVASRVVYP